MIKLTSCLCGGAFGSDVAWLWYTSTMPNIRNLLELALLAAFTAACGLIGFWVEE